MTDGYLPPKVFWLHVHQYGGWIISSEGVNVQPLNICFKLEFQSFVCLVAVQLVFETCILWAAIILRCFYPSFCLHHFFHQPFQSFSFLSSLLYYMHSQYCYQCVFKVLPTVNSKERDWLLMTPSNVKLCILSDCFFISCSKNADSLPIVCSVGVPLCVHRLVTFSSHPSFLPSSIPVSSPSNSSQCPSFFSAFGPPSSFPSSHLPLFRYSYSIYLSL